MALEVIGCKYMHTHLHPPTHKLKWSVLSDLPEKLIIGPDWTSHVKGAFKLHLIRYDVGTFYAVIQSYQ